MSDDETVEPNWPLAKDHLDEVVSRYEELGGPGRLALAITLGPLVDRYNSGERCQHLYDAMLSTE